MKKKSIVITLVIIVTVNLLAGCGEREDENRMEEVKESETETSQEDEWTETEAETGEELQVNCDDTEEMILLARIIYNRPDGTSTVECEYEYDSLGNRTKELIYEPDGNIGDWREWEYDAFGNLVKEKEYTPSSSVVDWPEEYWREREYDSSGNLTRETWYDFDGGIDECREYEYDVSGNSTKIVYYDSDRNVEYQEEWKYDEFGNQIMKSHSILNETNWIEWEYDLPENPTHETETHYDWDGSIYCRYERTYAPTGSLIREIFCRYYEDGSIHWGKECEYDFFGNKIMEITYEEYGRFNSRYEWAYDSFGNKITKIGYEENGYISNWCEWEYDSPENPTKETATYYNAEGNIIGRDEREYDAFGNRTREISYDADGNVKGSGWLEWERDEYGNCTKEIWYYPNGRIGYWREFEYITLGVVSEEDSADPQPVMDDSSYKASKQLPEEITKQIEIYVSEREVWLPEFRQFMPRYYYTWNDLNQDGSLELICSYYEGTGWYSHSYVYAINSDGEVECVAEIGGESAPDLLWGLKLYADVPKEGQPPGHFYIVTQDVIHDERYLDRIDTVITFTAELTEWQRERFRSCLEEYRDVTHSELVEATYWGSGWETISKEEWEQLEKEFLENKELITADFAWDRLWTYTYEELIENALTDKELGEALEALYISWQELKSENTQKIEPAENNDTESDAKEVEEYRIHTKRYERWPDGYEVRIEWPKVVGTGNQRAYNNINYILERDVFRDVGECILYPEEFDHVLQGIADMKRQLIEVSYELTYQDDKIFCVRIQFQYAYYVESGECYASGYHFVDYVFDINTGERLDLSDFIEIDRRIVDYVADDYQLPYYDSPAYEESYSFMDAFEVYEDEKDEWHSVMNVEKAIEALRNERIQWYLSEDKTLVLYDGNGVAWRSWVCIPYSYIEEFAYY